MNGALEQGDEVLILSDRKYLTRFLVRPAIVLALSVVLIALHDTRPPLTIIGSLLAIVLLPVNVWVIARLLLRMLRSSPAVILTPEGIVDDCSLLGCGIGLIPWGEIGAVTTAYWGRDGFFNFRRDWFVVIVPRDQEALLSRLSPGARMLRVLLRFVVRTPPGVCFPDFMLAPRPTETLTQIEEYLGTHARNYASKVRITKPDLERIYRMKMR